MTERIVPHNLPWKEVGRVKQCVIENLPVIGTEDDAPEAYVGGMHVEYILSAVNSHEALVKALIEAKGLIKIWHGNEAWDIYDTHSPEMLRINRALTLAEKGST